MRITYISHATLPSRSAHSIHIMKMCQAFVKNGCDVDLIATDRIDPDAGDEDLYHYYGVDPGFQLHRVSWYEGLKGKYFIYALLSVFRAWRLKGDVIYSRSLFSAWAAARFLNRPVIFESHLDEYNRGRIHERMISWLVESENCPLIVVISQALRDAWVERYPDLEDQMMVAHDGADLKEIDGMSMPDRQFTAGYIGHLYPGKGMEILSELVRRCGDVHFLIVGGTESDLRKWKHVLKRHDNVEFTGHVPHSETDRYLARMDVVMAPYQENVHVGSKTGSEIARWMSPLKLFEYMSARKAIICSDLPVIREVLEHRRNALLCRPGESSQWVSAIHQLREEPELREDLARQARVDLQRRYTWTKRAERVLDRIRKEMSA